MDNTENAGVAAIRAAVRDSEGLSEYRAYLPDHMQNVPDSALRHIQSLLTDTHWSDGLSEDDRRNITYVAARVYLAARHEALRVTLPTVGEPRSVDAFPELKADEKQIIHVMCTHALWLTPGLRDSFTELQAGSRVSLEPTGPLRGPLAGHQLPWRLRLYGAHSHTMRYDYTFEDAPVRHLLAGGYLRLTAGSAKLTEAAIDKWLGPDAPGSSSA